MLRNLKVAVVATFAVGLLAGLTPAFAQTSNVVIQWNQILQAQFGTAPSNAQRSLAMMHIAMFDAINAVEEAYTPYRVRVPASHGASAEAAGAQAARDVLAALYPAQQPVFDAALEMQLKSISPGQAEQGVEIGRQVARAVLEWRANDGWQPIAPDPAYVLPPFPGQWQPTPPANSFATFTFYPRVTPFALLTSTQYLAAPPPTVTSARYAADLNETKLLGSATSTVRTADETLFSQLVAGVGTTVGFLHVWNIVAVDVAQRWGLSAVDTARLFALLNASMHDGLQTSHTSKFVYGLWRPITAIRRAGEDLNDATVADPTWTPLLNTPPYPSHSSNMTCVGTSSARALARAFGRDDVPFSVTWIGTGGNPNVTRQYSAFSELAEQQARSRVYGGIHFDFELEASRESCTKVADWVADHYMRPLRAPWGD